MPNIFFIGKNSLDVTFLLLNLLKDKQIGACVKTVNEQHEYKSNADIDIYSIMTDIQIDNTILDNKKNVLVFTDCSFYENIANSFSYLGKDDYIVAYSDFLPLKSYFDAVNANLITYGTSPKSTLTASSILQRSSGLSLQVCVQRMIKTAYETSFSEQEFSVTTDKDIEINPILALVTVLIILDFSTGDIKI